MKKRSPWLPRLDVLAVLMVLVLLLSIGQRPNSNNLVQAEQTLTLSGYSDFPLINYASLTFAEGGGLFRLYDRDHLDRLQIGQTYTLTAGYPRGGGTGKSAGYIPNYTAIIAMTGKDGAIITTAADYHAEDTSPLFSLAVGLLLAGTVILLFYIAAMILGKLLGFRFSGRRIF